MALALTPQPLQLLLLDALLLPEGGLLQLGVLVPKLRDHLKKLDAAFADSTMMAVPPPLVPEVHELIARYEEKKAR